MPKPLQKYLDFITETAYLAGRMTLGYFQAKVQSELKADLSPVTQADRQSEQFIRSQIESRFPGHSIIGEEFGVKETAGADHRWIIDPIDGTKAFTRGVPLYGVLIGLEIEGRVEAGAAYFPGLDEMLAAATGLGCWWNGRRARVSQISSLQQAAVIHTDLRNMEKYGREQAFRNLVHGSYFRAGWGDAYGYLLVATGRAEVMLDPVMSVWDCGPFPAIFREAGGYFGDWQGNETIYGNEALAVNRLLLPEVLKLISAGAGLT